MAGFRDLFKTDETGNMGWGGTLLSGALKGLGSGQGIFGGLLGGVANKLGQKRAAQQQQKMDMASHLAAADGLDASPLATSAPSAPALGASTLGGMNGMGNEDDIMLRRRRPYLNY